MELDERRAESRRRGRVRAERAGARIDEQRAVFMISVAAELAEMHPQTLRMYEARGLITPKRSPKNTRLYSFEDVERLRRIQRMTAEEGLNLAGVETVLDLERQLERARLELGADAQASGRARAPDDGRGRAREALLPRGDRALRRLRRGRDRPASPAERRSRSPSSDRGAGSDAAGSLHDQVPGGRGRRAAACRRESKPGGRPAAPPPRAAGPGGRPRGAGAPEARRGSGRDPRANARGDRRTCPPSAAKRSPRSGPRRPSSAPSSVPRRRWPRWATSTSRRNTSCSRSQTSSSGLADLLPDSGSLAKGICRGPRPAPGHLADPGGHDAGAREVRPRPDRRGRAAASSTRSSAATRRCGG